MQSLDSFLLSSVGEVVAARLPPAGSASVIAVACSGGLDSSVLLDVLCRLEDRLPCRVVCLHVHHGLSPNADDWLTHCASVARQRGIVFDSRHVDLHETAETGIEEAARKARYAALGQMCTDHGATLLLTAHHQDDQVETVLLHLLRGTSVAGLAGMSVASTMPVLLGCDVMVVRPLLDATRAQLEQYAAAHAIVHIEDESNADVRYLRNAVRHEIAPVIGRFFPAYRTHLNKLARHAQSATSLLDTLASQDMAACAEGSHLQVGYLRQLDDERTDNVLRYWLQSHGWRIPSQAWLHEAREQLLQARDDTQPCVDHPLGSLRRHADCLRLVPLRRAIRPVTKAFTWQGEERMHFPEWGGSLLFIPASEGIPVSFLQAQPLQLRPRSGGEKLRLHPRQPARTLKVHYQMQDIPSWDREYLPLLWRHDTLLFAAGVGMNCQYKEAGDTSSHVLLAWQQD